MVSYFRWRQFPHAQEQMHAGLLRPDRADDVGAREVRQAAADIAVIGALGPPPKSVALVFDYHSDWVTKIQPQGQGFSALRLAFAFYTALRELGLDVDIVAPDAPLDGYAMVVIPCLPILPDGLIARLAAFAGPLLIGPRSGSKTADFAIPAALPPGDLQSLIPVKVVRVESLRPGVSEPGDGFAIADWFEHIESDIAPEVCLADGRGVVWAAGKIRYVAGWPDAALLGQIVARMAGEAGLATHVLREGLRLRRAGGLTFAFNYAAVPVDVPVGPGARFVIGGPVLPPAGCAVWD